MQFLSPPLSWGVGRHLRERHRETLALRLFCWTDLLRKARRFHKWLTACVGAPLPSNVSEHILLSWYWRQRRIHRHHASPWTFSGDYFWHKGYYFSLCERWEVSPDKCLWNPFAVHAGDGPCRGKTHTHTHSQKTHTAVFVSVDKTVLGDRERPWGGGVRRGRLWDRRKGGRERGEMSRQIREAERWGEAEGWSRSAPHRLTKIIAGPISQEALNLSIIPGSLAVRHGLIYTLTDDGLSVCP